MSSTVGMNSSFSIWTHIVESARMGTCVDKTAIVQNTLRRYQSCEIGRESDLPLIVVLGLIRVHCGTAVPQHRSPDAPKLSVPRCAKTSIYSNKLTYKSTTFLAEHDSVRSYALQP